jgi:hypothetical protein
MVCPDVTVGFNEGPGVIKCSTSIDLLVSHDDRRSDIQAYNHWARFSDPRCSQRWYLDGRRRQVGPISTCVSVIVIVV